jgi:hypothetical protein
MPNSNDTANAPPGSTQATQATSTQEPSCERPSSTGTEEAKTYIPRSGTIRLVQLVIEGYTGRLSSRCGADECISESGSRLAVFSGLDPSAIGYHKDCIAVQESLDKDARSWYDSLPSKKARESTKASNPSIDVK